MRVSRITCASAFLKRKASSELGTAAEEAFPQYVGRKVVNGYDLVAAKDKGMLNNVFKLPDIARKTIPHEQAQRLERNAGYALAGARIKAINKMLHDSGISSRRSASAAGSV